MKKKMKRFSNLFVYEHTNFDGIYKNCKLLENVYQQPGYGNVYALAGEEYPTIIVNMETSEIHFYEEFEDRFPIFTLHFKVCYI